MLSIYRSPRPPPREARADGYRCAGEGQARRVRDQNGKFSKYLGAPQRRCDSLHFILFKIPSMTAMLQPIRAATCFVVPSARRAFHHAITSSSCVGDNVRLRRMRMLRFDSFELTALSLRPTTRAISAVLAPRSAISFKSALCSANQGRGSDMATPRTGYRHRTRPYQAQPSPSPRASPASLRRCARSRAPASRRRSHAT